MRRPRGRDLAMLALGAILAAPVGSSASPDESGEPPVIELRLRRLPLPGALAMRPRDGRAAAASPAPGTPTADPLAPVPTAGPDDAGADDDATAEAATRARRRPRRGDVLPPAHLSERVIFRFDLGFGVDGGELSGEPTGAGQLLTERDYASLRVYGFGDAVLGTRGIGSPSLSTYFASQFRFDAGLGDRAGAIPSAWDGRADRLDIRHAYAEAHDLFRARMLRPITVRAGRQFRYGPAIAHFDGIRVGYETPALSAAVFAGARVDGVGASFTGSRGVMSGLELRLDLQRLRGVPLVIGIDALDFAGRRTLETSLTIRTGPDLSVRGSIRSLDDRLAMEKLVVHARLSDVTTLSADLVHRHESDWSYDYALVAGSSSTLGDARRYLDLGPVVPRLLTTVRAGTVLLDNVDVLLRGAAAFDIAAEGEPQTTFGDGYLEGGLAFEVRLRRAIGVGIAATTRVYDRRDVPARGDLSDAPDALPALATGGEQAFVEGGATVRYSAGARRFSTSAELYARSSRYRSPWDSDPSQTTRASHGGGRFSVEGWASNRFRLRAEYDISTALDEAPELHGLKSLRLLAEGSF